ncbi:MAG: hypothetical protein OXH34_05395 [Bacteroidetes bacterium]|nr:hypothetical protein [Bacteroidota bacterium]
MRILSKGELKCDVTTNSVFLDQTDSMVVGGAGAHGPAVGRRPGGVSLRTCTR